MKITILGTAYPFRGGLAAYNERLAREFQSNGNDVNIKTFTVQYPEFLFPGKTQYSKDNPPIDLKIERCLNSVNPFNWIKVGKKIKKDAPDLLIIKFWLPYMAPCLGTVARIVRKNRKTRAVTILDNLIPHEKRPGDKILAKYFCSSVDMFVAMSESVFSDINLFDRKKPRVICPHPLYDNFGEKVSHNDACKHLGLNPSVKTLLSFGLIRDYKGLDWLLEAYAAIPDRSDVKLVVAGEFYSDGEKYHRLAKELGIDDEVVWRTEFVPDSEVKYYFCAADLIVQPYKTATQSGVTQIAYHFEKPMLVTCVGGLSEIVPDGKVGYAVNPDPASISDALTRFLNEKPDFTEGIKEEKKKYSWARMAEAILNY